MSFAQKRYLERKGELYIPRNVTDLGLHLHKLNIGLVHCPHLIMEIIKCGSNYNYTTRQAAISLNDYKIQRGTATHEQNLINFINMLPEKNENKNKKNTAQIAYLVRTYGTYCVQVWHPWCVWLGRIVYCMSFCMYGIIHEVPRNEITLTKPNLAIHFLYKLPTQLKRLRSNESFNDILRQFT